MFTKARSLTLAFVAAFILTACGGGGKSVVPSQQHSTSASQGRKVMSVPCTPDSYGYCYVITYHSVTRLNCGPGNYAYNATTTYEIYNTTSDLGSYTENAYGSCGDVEQFDWEPSDPGVTYSDPNLP